MNEIYVKLGKLLRLERERKGLRLPDLSESLKISEENLQFIENGESQKLPAELYFKMFSKSYAEALGIDFEATVQAITDDIAEQKAATAAPEKEKARRAAEEARRVQEAKYGFRKKLIWLFVGIIAALVLFIALYKLFVTGSSLPGAPGTDATAPEEEQVKVALAEYDFDEPPSGEPEPIKMVMRARGESWATVLADGDTVVFRSLVPWREYEVEARYRITASVAHPDVVDISLNGQAVDLRDPVSRRISRVEIDQVNLASLLERTPDESEQAQPSSPPRESRPATPVQQQSPRTAPVRDTTSTTTPTPGGTGGEDAGGGGQQ